jgi:hypothetical protein
MSIAYENKIPGHIIFLPPAARGLFLKKPPPGPLQKLFIKGCGAEK